MHDPADCLRELTALAGVQAEEYVSFDWALIERDLGLRLPADYKLLADYLPSGWFRNFARLEKPEVTDGWPRGHYFLDEFGEQVMASMREWRAERDLFPYPVYPEPGGLLRWGGIWPGGHAFWLTEPADEPGRWPVVITSQVCEAWGTFDGPVCDFLVEVAAARYDTSGFTVGPPRVVLRESGTDMIERPVVLAEQIVFEPDSSPEPPRPAG